MLTKKVYSAIKRYHLLKRNDRVLVGVSGGPDSVSLLLILNELKNKLGIKIFVAHLNHQLRPEARAEELFVRKLAAALAIPILTKRVEIEKKGSLEERARKLRYEFFISAAEICRANKVALAHTRDDQAETVLMRLIRGSGLSGLSAIPRVRYLAKLQVVRPLMEVSKSDLVDFLKIKKQKFVTDKSNLQDLYFRNRIRNRLLPELEKYNKNIKSLLSNTADNLSSDYDYIRKESLAKFTSMVKTGKNRSVYLETGKLVKEHLAIQRMILRLALEKIAGDTRQISYQHWKEVEALISNLPVGSQVNLPKSISIKKLPSLIAIFLRKS